MNDVTPLQLRVAALPLRLRRRALRTLWLAQRVTRRLPARGVAPILRQTLRLPRAEAGRLDAETAFSDDLYGLEWLSLVTRSHADIVADWQSVRFADPELIRRVASSGKPVILAPLHMGCFALPFARLIHDFFRDRRMLILRAREDRAVETRVMHRISEMGMEMRFLNVRDKQDYIDAIRFARTGSVIVSFVDLPASYGGPVETTLFGRPIRLAMGIDSLARLTEAAVLPLSITSDCAGDTVRCGQPFEVADSGPETKARVTNLVRRHIETSVLTAPAQWFMWPRLHEFLHEGGQA